MTNFAINIFDDVVSHKSILKKDIFILTN